MKQEIKKYLYALLCILVLSGCSSRETDLLPTHSISFNVFISEDLNEGISTVSLELDAPGTDGIDEVTLSREDTLRLHGEQNSSTFKRSGYRYTASINETNLDRYRISLQRTNHIDAPNTFVVKAGQLEGTYPDGERYRPSDTIEVSWRFHLNLGITGSGIFVSSYRIKFSDVECYDDAEKLVSIEKNTALTILEDSANNNWVLDESNIESITARIPASSLIDEIKSITSGTVNHCNTSAYIKYHSVLDPELWQSSSSSMMYMQTDSNLSGSQAGQYRMERSEKAFNIVLEM